MSVEIAHSGERYGRPVAAWDTRAGVDVPLRFSGIEPEYEAVRKRVGVFDLSAQGQFRIAGEGSKALLQALLTRDVEYLEPGGSKLTLLLDEAARLVGDGTVYCLADDEYLLETSAASADGLGAHLSERSRAAGVQVADERKQTAIFAVEGPQAWRVVERVVDFDIAGLRYQGLRPANVGGRRCLVARTGYTAEYGYKLFVPVADAAQVWGQLLEAGAEYGIEPCGHEVWELCMLEVRFPNLAAEVPPDAGALEAGLGWLIDLRKDEFVGKAALLEQRAAGLARSLVCVTSDETAALAGGSEVRLGGETVGQVVHGAWSPGAGKRVGVAYVDLPLAASGLDLELAAGGESWPLRTVSAPMVVPGSWRERGGPR